MTKNQAIRRLTELQAQLEELLRVHSETPISDMAKASRQSLLTWVKKEIADGTVKKSTGDRIIRVLEAPDEDCDARRVAKASRAHVDSDLDDGDRSERDERVLALIRKGHQQIVGAIAAAGFAGGPSTTGARIPTARARSTAQVVELSTSVDANSKSGI